MWKYVPEIQRSSVWLKAVWVETRLRVHGLVLNQIETDRPIGGVEPVCCRVGYLWGLIWSWEMTEDWHFRQLWKSEGEGPRKRRPGTGSALSCALRVVGQVMEIQETKLKSAGKTMQRGRSMFVWVYFLVWILMPLTGMEGGIEW